MNNIKERKTNLEILRIISISMILLYYILWASNSTVKFDGLNIPKVFAFFIKFGRNVGVDIIILMAGYLLINDKKIDISRVIKYWLHAFIYSVILYFIFILFFDNSFDIRLFLTSLFPISFRTFGIISTYFILYLLHPYINNFLTKIDKIIYIKLLIVTTIIWCIIPTIINTTLASNDLLWFIYLYMVGAYIKLYKDDIKMNSVKLIIGAIGVMIIATILCLLLSSNIKIIKAVVLNKNILFKIRSIPTFLSCLLLFLGFKNLNIKNNNIINLLGLSSYGVFMLYCYTDIRKYIGLNIYSFNYNSISLIPTTFLYFIVIFIVFNIIEILRIYILENNYMKIITKKVNK